MASFGIALIGVMAAAGLAFYEQENKDIVNLSAIIWVSVVAAVLAAH